METRLNKKKLGQPHQPQQQGFASAGASGKSPLHPLTATSLQIPVRPAGQASRPIPFPPKLLSLLLSRSLFVDSTRVTNFSPLSFWAGDSYLSHRECRYIGILLLECLRVQLPKKKKKPTKTVAAVTKTEYFMFGGNNPF